MIKSILSVPGGVRALGLHQGLRIRGPAGSVRAGGRVKAVAVESRPSRGGWAAGSRGEHGESAGCGPGEAPQWPAQEGRSAGHTRAAFAGGAPGLLTEKPHFPPGMGAAGWLPQVTAFEPWKWVWTAASCGPDGQGLEGLSDLPDAPGLVSPEAEDEPSSC